MQLSRIFLACLLFSVNAFAQQYPFVYYTPKDGLVNSRVRSIKQDGKGRMYFITYGGLSVYDGSRFTNYRKDNGLANDLVNDIAEITPDSILVATNTTTLNTLVKGRVGIFKTDNNFCPLINRFIKSRNGKWYATSDDGLYVLEGTKFIKLPFVENGKDVGSCLDRIVEWKNFLLIIPWNDNHVKLFVYDREKTKIVAVALNEPILNIAIDAQGKLWLSDVRGIKEIDTSLLLQGLIGFVTTSSKNNLFLNEASSYLFFDEDNNAWLLGSNRVKKLIYGLSPQIFSAAQGLKTGNFVDLFRDREGITWIATEGNGVIKLSATHVELVHTFSPKEQGSITAINQHNDTVWAADYNSSTIYSCYHNSVQPHRFNFKKMQVAAILFAGKSLLLNDGRQLVSVKDKNNNAAYRHPQLLMQSTGPQQGFGASTTDTYGAHIVYMNEGIKDYFLAVIINGKLVTKQRISNATDQMAIDENNRLWIVTRDKCLSVFSLHPENPTAYLQPIKEFKKELPEEMEPRSLAIDNNNNVWIGTRRTGLYLLHLNNLKIESFEQFTVKNGLTDNFIYTLHCDDNNTIWIGTQTGLDKIYKKGDGYVISNISKTYNFFQTVSKIVTTSDNTAWALTNAGILKISPQQNKKVVAPQLTLSSLQINNVEHDKSLNNFSHLQNNFSFSVAAPSFVDERSILYSYSLQGNGNTSWTEPTNTSEFYAVNLAPGEYKLMVKAQFPEAMYAAQTMEYSFLIAPPWWQTLWFRLAAVLALAAVVILSLRFYYRRKLEKKIVLLEKQKAVEKERTRIATDMHDDLGAGLSRIKFLSETIGIKKQQQKPIEEDIGKIREYSHQMIDKMGEIVWALNEKNDSLSDLLSYTRAYSMEYLSQNGIACKVDMPDEIKNEFIRGEFRRNIFLSVKEALHNIVKHAQANNVHISIETNKSIVLRIKDDGKGFDRNDIRPFSNGLSNIEKRMRDIGGSAEIKNGQGTMVKLVAPLPH